MQEREARPKYVVTDRGTQLACRTYRQWCGSRRPRIHPRFGAVGQYGSIALVERFVRSLEDECPRRILVPLSLQGMRVELDLYIMWYSQYRPHKVLCGKTPVEVHSGSIPAHELPRMEPRRRWSAASRCASPQAPICGQPGARIQLHVSFLEGRRHLPIVELRQAA